MAHLSKKILLLLFPLLLLAEQNTQTPIKLIGTSSQQKNATVVNTQIKEEKKQETQNLKVVEKDKKTEENLEQTETNNQNLEIDKQLAEQKELLNSVIKNINDKKYKKVDNIDYNKKIDLLQNRVNLNKRYNNPLAVKRDQLKIVYLKQKNEFLNTLKNIVIGKEEYKDKKYFLKLIDLNIAFLNQFDIDKYTQTYLSEKPNTQKNSVANDFVNNYIELYNQTNTQMYILKALRDNMHEFRQGNVLNFFLDEFNLDYIMKQINSIQGISLVSNLTSYYLNFSIGELFAVFLIFLVFKFLNKYVIQLITSFMSKIFISAKIEDSDELRQSLKNSLKLPLRYSLLLLSLQLSFFILVKDNELINNILPWINTTYVALLTWGLYMLFDNIIGLYAQNLLAKYPNVRTEMLVFILRMIKILLFLIVILFLFTQLGLDIKAIVASLGVGGIAIALALKDTLANFFGSLNIMTDNSFSQGDWIKSDNVEGTVVDIRMRTTRIRTFDNAMITIPNSQLANTHIINWSKRIIGRRIKMSIGITYESKMENIKNLKDDIFEMLKEHPHIATSKDTAITKKRRFEATKREDIKGVKNTLLVYIDKYDNSSINILVYCFSRSPNWEDWLSVKEDIIIKIAKLVEKNSCEFAYPTQTLFLKDENIETLSKVEDI